MQQVGAKGFANAQPVDPRHFPVVIDRTGRNALVKAGHVWVLHRRLVLRGFGVLRLSSRNQAGFLNPKDGNYYGGVALKTIKFYPSSLVDMDGP